MDKIDYKHLISILVGILLGAVGSYFGIDFSNSCPPAPASASAPLLGK
jgi:hypothetical protein